MQYETDAEYNVRRQIAERAAADRSTDPIVRQIHNVLADSYSNRAGLLTHLTEDLTL